MSVNCKTNSNEVSRFCDASDFQQYSTVSNYDADEDTDEDADDYIGTSL